MAKHRMFYTTDGNKISKRETGGRTMFVTLRVNGYKIKEVNIPIENKGFKLDEKQLGNNFAEWLRSWLGVES
jgi:hypothetical protein